MSAPTRTAMLAWRVGAYAIDGALLLACVVASQCALILAGLHPFVQRFGTLPDVSDPALLHLWVFASTTLPFAAYFGIAFAHGNTVGQLLTGLRVTAALGGRLGAGAAALRAIVMLIPFELNHFVIFRAASWAGGSDALHIAGASAVMALCLVYLALPLLRTDRRSVHDLAAGSLVERPRPA